MLGRPGTFFNISSQGDFLKKRCHLICAVCSLPWCSLCSQEEKDKDAAPVTPGGSGWVKAKTLFCFPDQCQALFFAGFPDPAPLTARCGWLSLAFKALQQNWRWRIQLARVSSSPRSKADPQPLHSHLHLASFKSKENVPWKD